MHPGWGRLLERFPRNERDFFPILARNERKTIAEIKAQPVNEIRIFRRELFSSLGHSTTPPQKTSQKKPPRPSQKYP